MSFDAILNNPAAVVILSLAAIAFVAKMTIWYANVNSDRGNFNAFMEEVRKDVKEILSRLGPKVVAEDSPKQHSLTIDAESSVPLSTNLYNSQTKR